MGDIFSLDIILSCDGGEAAFNWASMMITKCADAVVDIEKGTNVWRARPGLVSTGVQLQFATIYLVFRCQLVREWKLCLGAGPGSPSLTSLTPLHFLFFATAVRA